MATLLADAIGWAGAACLLLAYAALASRRLAAGVGYHALNLAGAGGLAFNGAFHHALPSAALNVVWLAIGVVALRGMRRSRRPPPVGKDDSMITDPIDLAGVLAGFETLWSPRIVTRVNDYDVRVAKVAGEHVWHRHDTTDEFFLVLDGELRIALREEPGSERTVILPRGAVFVVPRGTEHKPSSVGGASILMFEPTGTSTVGDRHDPVPDHVDVTTGHPIG
jgi:mannose-6-phosphate isomerase-like protein (cupin superfamily)